MIEYIPESALKYLIIAPIVVTIILYYFVKRFSKIQWKAVHISSQWTAILYVIAVSILIELRFSIALFGSFLIAILILVSIHLIYQWKKNTDVFLTKSLKVISRFCFLLFGFAYLIFLFYELIEWLLV